MEIRIKTAEEFHASHVTIEIRAEGQAEVEAIAKRLCEGSGCPNMSDVRQELSAEVDRLTDEVARLTDTSEHYVQTMDRFKAKMTDAENRSEIQTGMLREATHQLGEISKIINHDDVTAVLGIAVGSLANRWNILSDAVQNVRKVLSSSSS